MNRPSNNPTMSPTPTTTPNPINPNSPALLWSCVARNDVILAEATPSSTKNRLYDDVNDGLVNELSIQLMKKKPTPGWEFHTLSTGRFGSGKKLKGIKFHVYDHHDKEDGEYDNNDSNTFTNPFEQQNQNPFLESQQHTKIIWSFGCVYDPSSGVELVQVQSFIEKIVLLTDYFRENEYDWNYGPPRCLQNTFGPTLQQRMEEVSYLGKMAMLNVQVNELESIMSRNIELILERETKLENLQKESTQLNEMAAVFKKQTKDVRRRMLWQNARHGLVIGTAVTAGVAAIVTPIVIAL